MNLGAWRLVGLRPETCMPGVVNVTLQLSGTFMGTKRVVEVMVAMNPQQAADLGKLLQSCSGTFRAVNPDVVRRLRG